MTHSIFLSCASYRDEEMPFTIKSAYENADNPQNLHIGIVQQSLKSERVDIATFSQNSQIEEIWIPAQKARGAGYARAMAQKMFNDEDFFLQVDSHTHFDPGWDTSLLSMYHDAVRIAGHNKVILSHFPKAYIREGRKAIPLNTQKYPAFPHRQLVYWFHDSIFSGLRIPFDDPRWSAPEESETILAGMVFAPGSIVSEVPYDPEICFWGEELSFSVRAWTRGWRIYSPNKMVLSHFYGRKGHDKVWDKNNDPAKRWAGIERESVIKQGKVYSGELAGTIWGAKDIESLNQYKDFIMMDIGQVFSKYLREANIIATTHSESDIFAGGDLEITPSTSLSCKQNLHSQCNAPGCRCNCHFAATNSNDSI